MTQMADFERKDFTSVPNILYDGYSELKPLDRHIAATLLRRCYMAGWHALSMRDISDLSGVPHNLMRSIEGREGILNRLQRVTEGIFSFKDGAIANRKGKKGRPQTYINVDTVRLWKANTAFYAANKGATQFEEPTTEDAITVSEGYSHPTKGRRKSVSLGYSTVSHEYNNTPIRYSDVSEGYSTVSGASVNVGTKNIRLQDTEDKKENIVVSASATTTPSQLIDLQVSCSQETQQPLLLEVEKPEDKPALKKKAGKEEIQQGLPAMPAEDAPWAPGTISAMFNHWRGHAPLTKGNAVRANEAAGNLYRAGYTREQIIKVYEHMRQQPYWIEQGGVEVWNVANNIAKVLNQINKVVQFPQQPQQQKKTFRGVRYVPNPNKAGDYIQVAIGEN